MSNGPSSSPATPSARRWRSAAIAAALLAGACAPIRIGTPPATPPPTTRAPTPAPGTPAPSAPALPTAAGTPVRVGLAVDTARVEVGATAGATLVDAGGRTVGRLAPGGRVAASAAGPGRVDLAVVDAEGRPLSGGWRGVSAPVEVRAGGGGVTIGGSPYRGDALLLRADDGVTAVNRVPLEQYLLGVVPREIGRVGPELLEAAKAQAVAARTYAVQYLGRRAELGFDVFATTADQVYGGLSAEHDPVSRAVTATAGEVLLYQGRPIEAYYHSTCAGRTAAIEEVWDASPVPYLVSVVDVDPSGEAYDRTSNRFSWTERWTHDQLVGVLNRTLADSLGGRSITEVRDVRIREKTPSGRVRAMTIDTDAGIFTVGRDRVRWILTPVGGGILNSSFFDVRVEPHVGGRIAALTVQGGGWGHGIGMCQVGAMGRARAGQDYRTILQAYYPGTELRDLY